MTTRHPSSDATLDSLEPPPWWVTPAAWLARRLPLGRYPFINQVCPRPDRLFWTALPATSGGAHFLCDLRDSVSREACFTGQYEPQETALLRTLLKPGMTVVDVGANWGYHTLLAAHLVGPGGRVISVEPDPRLFATLSRNVERNALDQVRVLQVAAADGPGTLRLLGFDPRAGNYGISRLAMGDGNQDGTFAVTARDLDGLLAELDVAQVDVLKMDIEGAEVLALAGLAQMLQAGQVRRLLLELHPAELAARQTGPIDVVAGLTAYGYRAWSLDHSPRMSKRVAYGRAGVADFVAPAVVAALDGAWPHVLLTAPGVEFQ